MNETEQHFPHEIFPAPDAATGTAAEWSTYHLVRACAYGKLLSHVILDDDPAETAAAVLGFLSQFTASFLLDHVGDDVARDLAQILDAGDVADEITWDRLVQRGIHPDTVRRFATREESAAKRAERLVANR